MLKQFYEKALPTQGVYCITSIGADKKVTNKFSETLDGVFEQIEKFKSKQLNTFVALGTFDGYSRKATDSLFLRSFFIDLDVGGGNKYETKDEALLALAKLIEDAELPDPVVVDSGGGVHAYWIMDQDIPTAEWKPVAEKFKALCQEHISIDPVVTADAARIMRAPETFNHKTNPPLPTSVVSKEINVYEWVEFKAFVMGDEAPQEARPQELEDVLASIPKGLDDDTKAIMKLDNFAKKFEVLAQKSIDDEGGCAQIKFILENAAALPEPLWHAGLSIAKFCDDGATAIHELSNPDPRYIYAKTEEKAETIPAPRTCDWFAKDYPERCQGCQHRGKITTPIQLAREFKPAAAPNKADAVREAPDTKTVFDFPDFMSPFVRGENGGIYFVPAPKLDKKGNKHQDDPILILTHDLYPIKRMVSPHDGECLQMRVLLPLDGEREFLLPMKQVYAKEALKAVMASNGVFFASHHDQHLMNYIIKWGQYLQTTDKALQMRMQMGWTEEYSANPSDSWANRSFVIGKKEYTTSGEVLDAPSSPWVRGLSKHLTQAGTYARWRESMDWLNKPEFELHAFASMCGFGSPLMCHTSTTGVTVSLTGRSGNAKTGAMYAGLSIFGNPKNLSVVEATDNGMVGRYLGLHSLMFGLDESGDKKPEEIGKLIHNVSHGKAKVRMQASVNAEREYEMSASLIAMLTNNHSVYGKLDSLKASPDGEAARVIEFLVHRPSILNENSKLGVHIFDAFRYNYGHAGPMYIQQVMKGGNNYVLDHIGKWNDKFLSDFGNFAEYRFYQNLVGSSFGGAAISNEHGITAYEIDRIYHQTVLAMIEIKDKVVKVNRTDYPSLLGDFINKNMGNILVLKDGKVSMEPRGQLVGRIVSEESLLQVSKSEFKKFLAERQVSLREFEFDMREKKILFDDKKGRLTTGWKSAISVDPAYCYWFRTSIPEEWTQQDDE
jgi:hypothetical protein